MKDNIVWIGRLSLSVTDKQLKELFSVHGLVKFVEFMPDGEYQETMFRRIEQDDPHIEHLGSWHSHHCNGLQTLSKRDIRGYFRTVNKENYRPQFFLTSLVKRIPDKAKTLDWIDHFLFVREVDDYYLVTDKVQIIDWPSTCGVHTGHSIGNQTAIQEPVSSPEDEPALRQSDRIWYETEEGRRVLAEDKRFFDKQFSTNVTATRKDSQITITGGIGVLSISATYPYKTGERTILVLVKKGNSQILEILSDMSYRRVSLVAALAAIEDIQKSAFIQEE